MERRRATGDGEVAVHRVRSARWGIAAGLIGIFLVTAGMLFDPDPATGQRTPLTDDLWVMVPALVVLVVLTVRAVRAGIVAGPQGVRVERTVTSAEVPWEELRDFEVRPTPNRWGWQVAARRVDDNVVTLATIPGRGARSRARDAADALAAALGADRERFGAPGQAGNRRVRAQPDRPG